MVELVAKDNKFNMGLFREIFRNLFVRTTNFSTSSESYVLKKIPKYQPVERYRAIMALSFKTFVTSISPFPTMIFILPKANLSFSVVFILLSANALNLDRL